MRTLQLSERQTAALEILGLVGFAVILKELFDPFFWRYAGPAALAITMVILTLYLNRTGQSWHSVGLRRLPGAKSKLLLLPQILATFAAMAAAIALVTYGGDALGWTFMEEIPEGVEARWGDIKGNIPLYLVWIAISWVIAGFAEEVLFRGFLITRLLRLFPASRLAPALAVILAGLFFGVLHYYNQGMRGFITASAIGIAFGIMFLLFKRNLWPIIFVHGSIDTLGFTVRLLDLDV